MDALEDYLSSRYWTEDELLLEVKADIAETAFWRWPFQAGVDYLACATVTRPQGSPLH